MAGRKAFNVTAALRRDVALMKADGWSDDRIAAQLDISRTTLLKHFPRELEFGADKVRREQLRNLAKASRKGSVAAANTLLKRVDATPVGTGRIATEPLDEKPEKLGKKAEATLAAETAHEGTEWGHLVKH
jgi:hypothetical protein